MPMRPCLDCGQPAEGSRCADCRRAKERDRGSRQERGYDAGYEEQLRDPAYVNATSCARCGKAFTADNPKTAGHRQAIRDGGKGGPVEAQCQDCNYGWRASGA